MVDSRFYKMYSFIVYLSNNTRLSIQRNPSFTLDVNIKRTIVTNGQNFRLCFPRKQNIYNAVLLKCFTHNEIAFYSVLLFEQLQLN